MTQPDQFFPSSAWNFGSIANLASLTQSDWENQISTQALSGHMNVLNTTYGANGLPTGTNSNIFSVVINALFQFCCGCSPGGTDLTSTLGNVQSQASDMVPGGVPASSLPFGLNMLQTLFGFFCGCSPGGTTIQGTLDNIQGIFETTVGPIPEGTPMGLGAVQAGFTRFTGLTPTGNTLNDLISSIEGLANNLTINDLPTGFLSQIPLGSLTNAPAPNLFPDSKFAIGSIPAGSEWSVDATSSRTSDGTGSALVIADGHNHALRTGRTPTNRVQVSAGQTLTVSIYCSYTGYSGVGGDPIKLQLVTYGGSASSEVSQTSPKAFPRTLPLTFGATVTTVTTVPAGGPVTIASYAPPTANLAWPGVLITGEYVVPTGVTAVQGRILVTDNALAGTLRFDEAEGKQTGQIQIGWVSGLPQQLTDGLSRWQLLLDTGVNSLTGSDSFQHQLDEWAHALTNIPPTHVGGVGGPANIGGSILDFLNGAVGGAVGTPGTTASIPDAFNIFNMLGTGSSLGGISFDILGRRNNTPVSSGPLPSSHSNFPLHNINASLVATQAASVICTDRIELDAPLGVLSWLGFGTSGITGFYINIWKIQTNGDWTLAHHSANFFASLAAGSTPQWNFYTLPTPLATLAGEEYAYELVPVGGTHTVRGEVVSLTDVPPHPVASIGSMGATRNNTTPTSPPSTIAKASLVRSANVPWIEVAIETGVAGDIHADQTTLLNLPGTYLYPIPPWANEVHIIGIPSAGGGHVGSLLQYGKPGKAGDNPWTTAKWVRGTEFNDSVDTIDVVIGDGGAGGTLLHANGFGGEDVTVDIPSHNITLPGGDGGDGSMAAFSAAPVGLGIQPPTFVSNGQTLAGGASQNAVGGAGSAPGGAGNGGGSWLNTNGGKGAPGAVWIIARTGDVVPPTPDTTPPTKPTATVDEITSSSITITLSGSTD